MDLDKLAKMADKITETASDSAQCAIASLLESKLFDLKAKIDRLSADMWPPSRLRLSGPADLR